MHIINATFIDIHEISFGACLDEIGVYVLWSKHATRAPSYIGEGDVVARVAAHMRDARKPFLDNRVIDGCVAIMDPGHPARRKSDAEIVEFTLLEIADELGVSPTHNAAPGKFNPLDRRTDHHDTVRINVRGQHPLKFATKLRGTQTLTWRRSGEYANLDPVGWR